MINEDFFHQLYHPNWQHAILGGLSIFFLILLFLVSIAWYWLKLYVPNLMFYHYTALAMSIACFFVASRNYQNLFMQGFQGLYATLSLITTGIYLNELVGGGYNVESKFEGEINYPQFLGREMLVITSTDEDAERESGMAKLDIAVAFLAFFLSLLLMVLSCGVTLIHRGSRGSNELESYDFKTDVPCECSKSPAVDRRRNMASILALVIIGIATTQSFIGIGLVSLGGLLITPFSNYLVFLNAISIMAIRPPLVNKGTSELEARRTGKYGKVFGCYMFLFFIVMVISWAGFAHKNEWRTANGIDVHVCSGNITSFTDVITIPEGTLGETAHTGRDLVFFSNQTVHYTKGINSNYAANTTGAYTCVDDVLGMITLVIGTIIFLVHLSLPFGRVHGIEPTTYGLVATVIP